ncbi:MAG: hypothetical protein M1840_000016 [Geoglossum simile]|nr:MAG: hypothetical protein M1840_000016 [Geoglossum simile]
MVTECSIDLLSYLLAYTPLILEHFHSVTGCSHLQRLTGAHNPTNHRFIEGHGIHEAKVAQQNAQGPGYEAEEKTRKMEW